MELARECRENRNSQSPMTSLRRELAMTGREIDVNRMRLRARMERRESESLMSFWIRSERMVNAMFRIGVAIPDILHFNTSIYALKLNSAKMSALLSVVEVRNMAQDWQELRRLSVKLFESPFLEPTVAILEATAESPQDDDLG